MSAAKPLQTARGPLILQGGPKIGITSTLPAFTGFGVRPATAAMIAARKEAQAPPQRRKHEWGPSTVGHGEAQCTRCRMTNREAWVLGEFCTI